MAVRVLLTLLTLCVGVTSTSLVGPKGEQSDLWLLKGSMSAGSARNTAAQYGFTVLAEKPQGYYVLKQEERARMSMTSATLRDTMMRTEPKITDLRRLSYRDHVPKGLQRNHHHQQQYHQQQRQKRSITITDSNWDNMWHASETQYPSLGVYNAWVQSYTGAGIHVSVLDDGVQPDHPDLVANYVPSGSFDYLDGTQFVNHSANDFHGTWCAGIISATKNDDCVLGMAYESTFSSVKIFDSFFGLTDYGESLALGHNGEATDIYSNSWGPPDSGNVFAGPGELAALALKEAATQGRNGKGAIFTWAAGNGGDDDDCNCDGYAGSIYTISVTAIGPDQGKSWYSEDCSSTLVGAYSGDSPDLRITTTDTGSGCTNLFQGTSASCPMAAGVIALVLQANPDLTWRDMQHLVVETATTKGLVMPNWKTNGAGKLVSHSFGFGLLNAAAMVERAQTWDFVPAQEICSSSNMVVGRTSSNGDQIVETFSTDGCGLRYVEHVEVWANFGAGPRGALQITLTSPQGTESRLLKPRRFDLNPNMTEWTFMTVHNWGENPAGQWSLMVEVTHSSIEFQLEAWQITLYGTRTLPESMTGTQPTEEEGSDTAAIVGGTVGGVAGLGIIGGVAYYFFLGRPKVAPVQ